MRTRAKAVHAVRVPDGDGGDACQSVRARGVGGGGIIPKGDHPRRPLSLREHHLHALTVAGGEGV